MPPQLDIVPFLQHLPHSVCVDVRSPAEFAKGHIPGAVNLPLFSNEERATVGTLYKKQGRQEAIKAGLEIVGPKMRGYVEFIEEALQQRSSSQPEISQQAVLVYCWRGGMRSASLAWLLELYGFRVNTLRRGYKTYRSFVLKQMEEPYPLLILGGNTGAGKTHILHELAKQGEAVIDLERLAGHKGSAFGWLGESYQPTQEHFENLLGYELYQAKGATRLWLEDESRRIGNVNIPNALWQQMRTARVMYIDMPLALRVQNSVADYGNFSKAELGNCINRISERLGGAATKEALAALEEGNYERVVEISLRYYDKFYRRGLEQRQPDSITSIPVHNRTIPEHVQRLLESVAQMEQTI